LIGLLRRNLGTSLPVSLRATRLVLVFESSSEKMPVKYCR
jgi:hypothetical protein